MEDVREGASAAIARLMVINSSTAAVFGACILYLVWVASLCQGLLAQRQFQLYCGGLTMCYWGVQQQDSSSAFAVCLGVGRASASVIL